MEFNDIEKLRIEKKLAYDYIRGSHLHGIATETSDVDRGGVYFAPKEEIIGLRVNYTEQVSDERSDETYYEFGRWMELLAKGNPTALESLFAPEEFIVGEIDPSIKLVIENRDRFLSKQCFSHICGYAYSQIKKARGLNKKIVNPVYERKTPLDFCFTFNGEGSIHLQKWLDDRGLKQKYCGISCVNNMPNMYCLFYDFGAHRIYEKNGESFFDLFKDSKFKNFLRDDYFLKLFDSVHLLTLTDALEYMDNLEPIGYRGIIKEDGTSNDLHISSIPKGEIILCYFYYNDNSYRTHCREYKEYKEWEKMRNKARYESNLDKNYDAKNMCECIRILKMGLELAEGKGFNVKRTEDRQFLLDIKAHKYEYDELVSYAEELNEKLKKAIETSDLPDDVDMAFVNQLTIDARRKYYDLEN